MKFSLLKDSGSLRNAVEELFKWADTVTMAFAWASSSGGRSPHWRCLDLAKIRRAVIGTQFAQTEPFALRVLNERKGVLRVAINSSGTFHPKCILAVSGGRCRAVVGSANLTGAAFSTNTELGVMFEGPAGDSFFVELAAFIDEQWNGASEVDEDWIRRYEEVWKQQIVARIRVPNARLDLMSIESLRMSWGDYYRLLQEQHGRKLVRGGVVALHGAYPSYMDELDRVEAIFDSGRRFEDLDYEDRRTLMGFGENSSGFIGSMTAAGFAKEVVRKWPEQLGVHLDQLPRSGQVPAALVETIVGGMMEIKGVKLGVASRLLTVKRPDLFVSVNKGSSPALEKITGGKAIRTVADYMNLLKEVWSSQWFQSSEPADPVEKRIWQRKTALLDAALYEQIVLPT